MHLRRSPVLQWRMTRKARQVLREALTLPPRARADIDSTLLYSLDVEEDQEVESAWGAEVERRLREVESGQVKLLPWESVRREARAGLKRTLHSVVGAPSPRKRTFPPTMV